MTKLDLMRVWVANRSHYYARVAVDKITATKPTEMVLTLKAAKIAGDHGVKVYFNENHDPVISDKEAIAHLQSIGAMPRK